MKKLFVTVLITALSICLYNCASSAEKQNETLEKELSRGVLQHFDEKNCNAKMDDFTSFIGTTRDVVEFKENGDVYLRLSKDCQILNITKKQQQHRLRGLKNLVLETK